MEDKLKNPFRPVKSVRTVYDKFYQKNVKEVQVQFKDEDPAWIPYDTLIAMMESEIEQ